MKSVVTTVVAAIAALSASNNEVCAFAPTNSRAFVFGSQIATTPTSPFDKAQGSAYVEQQHPVALQRQRRSVTSVSTMSLFGLGGPELAVILVAAAFLLGPNKLAELGKDAGKIAGELKEVPKEFQKGLAEGEEQAMAMKKKISSEDVKDAEKEE